MFKAATSVTIFSFSSRNIGVVRLVAQRLMSSKTVEEPEVLFHETGSSRTVILNRPKKLNALNLSMIRQIDPVVRKWESDSNAKIVVMKGAGHKAFCAGGDVVHVAQAAKTNSDLARDFFREEYVLDYLLATYRKPYVAIIDGITMGGGVGLSALAKFRVCTEKTRFAMPETAIGLFPDVGGSYFLPKLKNHLGFYLALTGTHLIGEEVFKAGIATHYVASSQIPLLEEKLAGLDSSNSEQVKNVLDSFHSSSSSSPFILQSQLGVIDECFSGRTLADTFARLKAKGTDWTTETIATMKKMSPLAMHITLQQLRFGEGKSLDECFKMEYRLSQSCSHNGDFQEGVRALLIDRDNAPKWKHASYKDVTQEQVASFFQPLVGQSEWDPSQWYGNLSAKL